MKKFNLSLVAILAMSTFAIAIEEAVIEAPANDNGLYLGIAYSTTNIDIDGYNEGGFDLGGSNNTDAFMVQAGYKINAYIAIEGRYWNGDNELDAWGLYAKPMYPVNASFDIYGLLGYGNIGSEPTEYNDISLDDSSLQWGLGASYAFTDNISVFVDYVELYNNDNNNIDWSLDAVNLGVTYQF
jgi:opacity protein-like surface antigen